MKRTIKVLFITIIATISAGILLSISVGAVETFNGTMVGEKYMESYTDMTGNKVAGSPYEAEADEDGVNPATGDVMLTRTDIELEGKNGFDFELSRYYNSSESGIGQPWLDTKSSYKNSRVRIEFKYNGETINITIHKGVFDNSEGILKELLGAFTVVGVESPSSSNIYTNTTKMNSAYEKTPYIISNGWYFDLPWVETMYGKTGNTERVAKYLHFGSIGMIKVNRNNEHSGLRDYNNKDVRFSQVSNSGYKYVLKEKDGTRTFFNANGLIIEKKDKHNNSIKFEYSGMQLSKITDSVGRTINFSYRTTEGVSVLQYAWVKASKQVAGGVDNAVAKYNVSTDTFKTWQKKGDETADFVSKNLTAVKLNSVELGGSVPSSGVQAKKGKDVESYTYEEKDAIVSIVGTYLFGHTCNYNGYMLLKTAQERGESKSCYEYASTIKRGNPKASDIQGISTIGLKQQFYAKRAYEKNSKNKVSNDLRYVYFQIRKGKDKKPLLLDYKENIPRITDADVPEVAQYSNDVIQNIVIATQEKKPSYTKSHIDMNNGYVLTKKATKNRTVYRYNRNKLLISEATEGKSKTETLYGYGRDIEDNENIFVSQTVKMTYGSKSTNKPVITKTGTTYDDYGNVLKQRDNDAFLKPAQAHYFTTLTTYFNDGVELSDETADLIDDDDDPVYDDDGVLDDDTEDQDAHNPDPTELDPDDQTVRVFDLVETEESYTGTTKTATANELTSSKLDIYQSTDSVTYNGNNHADTMTRNEYDSAGNVVKETTYQNPSNLGTDYTEITYIFNAIGQVTNESTFIKTRDPISNSDGTEQYAEETEYDEFGNTMSETDKNGVKNKTTYDPLTGEELTTIENANSAYATDTKTWASEDGLKTFTMDKFGRIEVSISDEFGNEIINKSEISGTWTENDYEYSEYNEEDEDEDEVNNADGQLVEQRTYTFEAKGSKIIVNNGEEEGNYDIGQRGDLISAERIAYDEFEEEIMKASFAGSVINASTCVSWQLNKSDEEVNETTGYLVTKRYEKILKPSGYTNVALQDSYYTQFDGKILSETITETISDEKEQTRSEITIETKGNQKLKSTTTYQYTETGEVSEEKTVTEKTSGSTEPQIKESKKTFEYGMNANAEKTVVSEKQIRNKNAADVAFQSNEIKSAYDMKGRQTQAFDPQGTKDNYSTYTVYDAQSRVVEERAPKENENGQIAYSRTRYKYDSDEQLVEQQDEITESVYDKTEYGYDDFGNQTLVKQHLVNEYGVTTGTQVTQYLYDFEGNKIRQFTGMTEPMNIAFAVGGGGSNLYTYGGIEYHINIDSKGQDYRESRYEYSLKNELISFTDPMGKKEIYKYDNQGNLKETIDKDGNVTSNKYDTQNRVTKITAKDSETGKLISHSYDYEREEGFIERADDSRFEQDDINGGITKESIDGTKKIVKNTTYDVNGNRDSFEIKVGGKQQLGQQFKYDSFDRLAKVWDVNSDGTKTEAASYDYTENGNIKTGTVADGAVTNNYSYNLANQVNGINIATREKASIAKFNAKYRKNGQKVDETSSVLDKDNKTLQKTSSYTYDSLGRIAKEETGDNTQKYYYDASNNRIQMNVGDVVTKYRYNKNDELMREENGRITQYHYDNRGNQVGTVLEQMEKLPANAPAFTMDMTLGENRLNGNVVNHYNALNQVETTLTKNYKVRYEYNIDGLRTKKRVNTSGRGYVDTNYIWDGDQLVLELDKNLDVKKRYIRGSSLLYSDSGEGTEKTFYTIDDHGSVIQLVDKNGEVIKAYDYDSFGNEVDSDPKDMNLFRYSGEYFDKETETYYLRARYYDPSSGRFISEDPAEDGLNWYTYCENDPVNKIDPSGHTAEKVYDTSNKAAIAWAKDYYGMTRYVRYERASAIYIVFKGNSIQGYAYKKPKTGEPHSVTPDHTVPSGTALWGIIHSHPNSKEFSSVDMTYAENNAIAILVVVPGSSKKKVTLKKYADTRRGYRRSTIKTNFKFTALSKKKKKTLKANYKDKWKSHKKSCTGLYVDPDDKDKAKLCKDKKWPYN